MAIIGISQSDYEVVAFTEDSPNATESELPVVVVLRGGRRHMSGPPARSPGRLTAAAMQWAGSWSNGYEEVHYSRARRVVSVMKREFDLCGDGRTLVVLADASRPADAAVCHALTDLPIPPVIAGSTASVLWRMLKARLLTGKPYRWPHEAWLEHVTGIPVVHEFLKGAASRTR